MDNRATKQEKHLKPELACRHRHRFVNMWKVSHLMTVMRPCAAAVKEPRGNFVAV